MDSIQVPEQYYTFDGRLASFQITQAAARRGSNAKGKATKQLAWPHKNLNVEDFARAGFYFEATPDFPDNTVCFLCCKNMGGWEDNDNPFEEHLRLSPHCGWAIVSGIEVGLGDYGLDDPTGTEMTAARKATFAGRWPHEGKRGWKCKTKQLVDAGWKYTPTMDSDDMATCTYCQLALDGWEPKDNPMDEHYRRSPDCQFFNLIDQYKSTKPAKKKGRGKATRSSKASRASVQSVATAASDVTSLLDQTADHEDSVMTTTSVMTQGGTRTTRAKKGTAAKGRKGRAKKEEPVEVLEDPPELPVEPEFTPEEVAEIAPQPKPTRGRKRTSAAIEDSVLSTTQAPAPKKRATRGRVASTKVNNDHAMFDPAPPEVDEAAVDAELKALEDEMEVDPEPVQVPKKGRKAGTRKVSKQTTKKSKAKAQPEPTPEPEAAPEPVVDTEAFDELAEGHDMSVLSNATVVRTSLSSSTGLPKKRGRPSKKAIAAKSSRASEAIPQPSSDVVDEIDHAEPVETKPPAQDESPVVTKPNKKLISSRDKSLPAPPPTEPDTEPDDVAVPTTPPKATASAAAATGKTVASPSHSPQSSDAENQPPSSKPSSATQSTRVALAPIAATPVRMSPSKRNVLAGLQSTEPWKAADVDSIFQDLEQENIIPSGSMPKSMADLTSPEKRMTVEEWIYHNAQEAEKKLKAECEAIVNAFEREGTRAMRVLEGIVVD